MNKRKAYQIENENILGISLDVVETIPQTYYPYTTTTGIHITWDRINSNEDHYCYHQIYDTPTGGFFNTRRELCYTSNPENYISLEAIKAGEKGIDKLRRAHWRMVKSAYKMAQYIAIADEAKFHNMPRHYKTDMTHWDAYRIASENPDRFLWTLRDYGTHMILPPAHLSEIPEDETRQAYQIAENNKKVNKEAREYYHTLREAIIKNNSREARYYVYERGELYECTAANWHFSES
jgi:hypothetical protein